MLFSGLMTQSEISQLLDALYGNYSEEASLSEAEGVGATLREEEAQENTDFTLLAA